MKPLLVRLTEQEREALEAYRSDNGLRSESAAVRHLIAKASTPAAVLLAMVQPDIVSPRFPRSKEKGAGRELPQTRTTHLSPALPDGAYMVRVAAPYGVDARTGEPLPKPQPSLKKPKGSKL